MTIRGRSSKAVPGPTAPSSQLNQAFHYQPTTNVFPPVCKDLHTKIPSAFLASHTGTTRPDSQTRKGPGVRTGRPEFEFRATGAPTVSSRARPRDVSVQTGNYRTRSVRTCCVHAKTTAYNAACINSGTLSWFSDADSRVRLQHGVIMNADMVGIWKEAVAAYLKALSRHSPEDQPTR